MFAGLTPEEFELIISAAREKYVSEGEIMFKRGSAQERTNLSYMLVSGLLDDALKGSRITSACRNPKA